MCAARFAQNAVLMPSRPSRRFLARGLDLLYEDRDILVVNKPAGLLTMGTEREKSRTAYAALTDYVRKGTAKSRTRIFIVHRLDKETSGVLVFAKNEAAKIGLQSRWEETEKRYLAVVHGTCARHSETMTSYLAENSAHAVYSTPSAKEGKFSQTAYTVLKETKGMTLLDVELLTGRKHQIRVQLAERGHPVVGDKKYGRADRAHTRLALHARSLSIRHPFSGDELTFEAQAPPLLKALVGNFDYLLRQRTPATDAGAGR